LYLWLYVIATVVNWHISREHKKFRLKMKKKKNETKLQMGESSCSVHVKIIHLHVKWAHTYFKYEFNLYFYFILSFFQRVLFRSTAQKVRDETTIVPVVSEVPVWMVPPCSAISNRIVQMLETKRNRFVVSY